ncbi:MAG: hypothetical protein AB7L90_09535 [Hyphomicrobiaceae bacterium]
MKQIFVKLMLSLAGIAFCHASVTDAADDHVTFLETFTGSPQAPTRWSSPRWDIIVHDRTDGALNVMNGEHSAMCGPPPATHSIHSLSDSVFQCRDHVMTSLQSSDPGYAVAYLTPSALLDWSAGKATFEFDVSTKRSTKRDWIDIWFTPWQQNMVLPSEDGTPDLNGPPRQALHFRLSEKFAWQIYRQPGEKISRNDWQDLKVPYSSKQRDRFTIMIGAGQISMLYRNAATNAVTQIERVALPATLGFDRAVVQIGHHSYTPGKDCSFTQIGSCGPNTWHWDNVRLSPARAFKIEKIGRRLAGGTIPVSPGWLRLAARGPTEVDWGEGWTRIEPVNGAPGNVGHFASYFIPVPAGVTEVRLRGSATWAGPWRAEDISIWSQDVPPPPSPEGRAKP